MQQVRIDFDNPGLPQSLGVVEGESQSRIFQAALYKSGAAYTAPAGAVYSIMYRGFGPQNQGWYDTIEDGAGKRAACTVSGNVVTCELARQALRVPGHLTVVLCVSDAKGYMLKSWPIMADVRNDGYEDTGELEMYFNLSGLAGNYLTQLEKAMADAEATKNNLISTSTQVQKDIDAKAAETLKTIPESYTELDGNVKQLKEDIGISSVVLDFSGNVGDTYKGKTIASDFVPSKKYLLDIKHDGSSEYYVNGVSASGEDVARFLVTKRTDNFSGLIAIPESVTTLKLVVVKVLKTSVFSVKYGVGFDGKFLKNESVSRVKFDADTQAYLYLLDRKIKTELNDIPTINGQHVALDGTFRTNAAVTRSEYIRVFSGDVVKYKSSGSTSFALLTKYNPDKKYTETVAVGNGWTNYIEGTYKISDEGYVVFCYITERKSDCIFELSNESKLKSIKEINEKINSLDGSTEDIEIDDYWKEELDKKIQHIKENEEKGNIRDVMSFVFITDMHYPYNFRKSPKLIKYISDNTNIHYILNGGDSIHNNSSEVYIPADCVKMIYEMRKDFKNVFTDNDMYSTLGNHDLNTQGNAIALTANQIYDCVYKKCVDYTAQGGWAWYYQDDSFHKIRFVSIAQYFLNQEHLRWLGDVALNVPSADWGIVFFSHALPYNEPNYGNSENRNASHLKEIIDAFQQKTAVSISDSATSWPISYSKDFSSANGKIICYIAGHIHHDYMKRDTIQYVCTVNDSKDNEQFDKVSGTISEQSFDVFTVDKTNSNVYITRIGHGDNREFSF